MLYSGTLAQPSPNRWAYTMSADYSRLSSGGTASATEVLMR